MDFVLLNILFFAVLHFFFVIFIVILKLIFALLDMATGWETPTVFIGLFAGVISSLIMIAILRGMPV
jgi:hypothetical protein